MGIVGGWLRLPISQRVGAFDCIYFLQYPRITNASHFSAVSAKNIYAYVGNDPISFVDPWGLRTTVIIIDGHSALLVDNSGEPVLYDPAGSYCPNKNNSSGSCSRGSGDAFYGDEININDYFNFHLNNGDRVRSFPFPTSPAEEAAIVLNIETLGGAMGGLCTDRVSRAISGIGPFKGLPIYLLPSSLGNDLDRREHK